MKSSTVFAHLRVLAVTCSLGLAFGSLSLLAYHYYMAARTTASEKEAMKGEIRGLVERLADVEASLATVAAYRKTLDNLTLTEFESVMDRAGLRASSESGIKVAMRAHPATAGGGGESNIQAYSGALVYGRVIDRLANAKGRAETLSAELKSTADLLSQRQEILAQIPSVLPADGWISSEFGVRESPFHRGTEKMHNGIDIAADPGTPVFATADGVVAFAGSFGSYGKFIKINHGFGISTRYAHNAEFMVKTGDKVTRGQQIATIGVTGRTTGPHLHYEVMVYDQPVNPRRFFFGAKPGDGEKPQPPLVAAGNAPAPMPMGGDDELVAAHEPLTFEEAAAAALSVEEKPAVLATAWDAPVFTVEKGLLARVAPRGLRNATTADMAMAAAMMLVLAVAFATMRMPEPVRETGKPLTPIERYFLRQERDEILAGSTDGEPMDVLTRLKLAWIERKAKNGAVAEAVAEEDGAA